MRSSFFPHRSVVEICLGAHLPWRVVALAVILLAFPSGLLGCSDGGKLPASPTVMAPQASQTAQAQPTAELTLTPEEAAPPLVPEATATSISVAEPTPSPVVETTPKWALYNLDVVMNYPDRRLEVLERIDYPNLSSEALIELLLVVEPNLERGGFSLNGLVVDGKLSEDYTLQGNRLSVALERPLMPGQLISLEITYQLKIPVIPPASEMYKPIVYGYTERQVNLVDWFPYLPPYQPGSGWMAYQPGYFGEHQVYDMADFRVSIRFIDPAPGLVVAASAPQQVEGDEYRYALDAARTFAWSVSPEYQVFSDTVGGVTVLSYAFPIYDASGQAALLHTRQALSLYSEMVSPYRHTTLSVVQGDFNDGMEYDGLFFLSRGFYNLYDGTPIGYLAMISVHETAHQWWYGLVGNNQPEEPWLDEALCTYFERLYYERAYPDLVNWWWAYRVDFYHPNGPINKTIYDYQGFLPYRDSVYLRGAQFLEELRTRIGDEAFFAFLRDYAARYAYRQATTADFFVVLKDHYPDSIEDLLTTYFPSP